MILSDDDLDAASDRFVSAITDQAFMLRAQRECRDLANGVFDRDLMASKLEQVLQKAVKKDVSGEDAKVGSEFRKIWSEARKTTQYEEVC